MDHLLLTHLMDSHHSTICMPQDHSIMGFDSHNQPTLFDHNQTNISSTSGHDCNTTGAIQACNDGVKPGMAEGLVSGGVVGGLVSGGPGILPGAVVGGIGGGFAKCLSEVVRHMDGCP